jgi:pimeloyl-ACP methyl ester carboxylesterase
MIESPAFLQTARLRFAYLASGEVGAPLVLMVHGFPDTAHSWDLVRPAVAAAGYRVVAPFTRGYAPTEIPSEEAFDADTLGGDLAAIIEALGEKSAIVVGHDWGASAAYSVAALHPERVRLLITLAIPHPASVVPTPKMLWTVRHFFTLRWKSAVDRARKDDFAMIDELVRRWSPAWDVPPGETEAVKRSFREPGSLDAALGYYRALRPWLPPSQKKRVEVPTVSFAGENDNIDVSAYERARSRFKSSYDVVKMPGGHFLHREHPDRFRDELLAVLARHAPTNSAA